MNEIIEANVMALDEKGCASTDQPRVMVFGALPGERVTCRPITKRAKKLFCRTDTIVRAAKDRVTPRCEAASFCGGCQFQHMSDEAELAFKLAQVKNLFEVCPPGQWLDPIVGETYGYRTKARLGVKFVDKKQRVLVGFRETMKPYIAETSACPVLKPPVDDLLDELAELIAGLSIPRSVPQIELAMGDGDCALVFRHLESLQPRDTERLTSFGQSRGIQIYLQPGNTESVHRIFPGGGPERLYYELAAHELKLAFHPLDFTQVNLPVNRLMIDQALRLLELNQSDHVLDAFCGIGNFSLVMAKFASTVIGREGSTQSVARATENALHNEITNVSFETVDLHPKEAESLDVTGFNKVLLDPPRTGAEALCKKLASSNIERVGYVSCNPQTLLRDAQILVEGGFRLQSLGLINMFPNTTHIESMALFVRG